MEWCGVECEWGGPLVNDLYLTQAGIEDPLDSALDVLEALREKFSRDDVMAAIDAAGLRDATDPPLEQEALTVVELLDKALDAHATFEQSASSVQAILAHEKGHMLQHLLQTATWKAKEGNLP